MQNLLESASSTGYNFKFLWDDRMSNRWTMQNSSSGQTDHLSPYRLLELQSGHCFCCCFSSALKSQECCNPSFLNGQRNLQVVIYDNFLLSHQASNRARVRPVLPQTLNAESFWNQAVPAVQKAFWRWEGDTTSWVPFISMVKASWTRGHSRSNPIWGCSFHTLRVVLISKQRKALLDL